MPVELVSKPTLGPNLFFGVRINPQNITYIHVVELLTPPRPQTLLRALKPVLSIRETQ